MRFVYLHLSSGVYTKVVGDSCMEGAVAGSNPAALMNLGNGIVTIMDTMKSDYKSSQFNNAHYASVKREMGTPDNNYHFRVIAGSDHEDSPALLQRLCELTHELIDFLGLVFHVSGIQRGQSDRVLLSVLTCMLGRLEYDQAMRVNGTRHLFLSSMQCEIDDVLRNAAWIGKHAPAYTSLVIGQQTISSYMHSHHAIAPQSSDAYLTSLITAAACTELQPIGSTQADSRRRNLYVDAAERVDAAEQRLDFMGIDRNNVHSPATQKCFDRYCAKLEELNELTELHDVRVAFDTVKDFSMRLVSMLAPFTDDTADTDAPEAADVGMPRYNAFSLPFDLEVQALDTATGVRRTCILQIRQLPGIYADILLVTLNQPGTAAARTSSLILDELSKSNHSHLFDFFTARACLGCFTATPYMEQYPGLLHFIIVERGAENRVVHPDFHSQLWHTEEQDTGAAGIQHHRDAMSTLKQFVWATLSEFDSVQDTLPYHLTRCTFGDPTLQLQYTLCDEAGAIFDGEFSQEAVGTLRRTPHALRQKLKAPVFQVFGFFVGLMPPAAAAEINCSLLKDILSSLRPKLRATQSAN